MADDADDLAAALLSEAGWVRRVATRLVRDGSGDDLAQDAWLLALKARPDASTTLRGWLTEAMRRLAHTRARAEARRRARERSDDPPDAPAADRLLEKAELLHRIGQMVGALEEPYRSTVLLRYFEGASAAEIARRHGVPAGTVRWRLKEALDRLRAQLGREVDRDRALRALVPIAGAKGGLMIPMLELATPILKLAAIAVFAAAGVGAAVVVTRHARTTATQAGAPAVARAGSPATAGSVPAPPASPASDDPRAGGSPGDDTLRRAQDAYVRGDYDDAVELAKQVLPQDPHKAWRIIGASSCFKQDAAGAGAAWDALDRSGRKFIEYVCKRNDVTLPSGAPVL